MKNSKVTVVILTYNEEKHLQRCIKSCLPFAEHVIVVDSYSDDQTLDIAKSYGTDIYQHPFVNQAKQFQWALDTCDISTEWVMRMDADEYVTDELSDEINQKISEVKPGINGIILKRQMHFLEHWIKHGGVYPVKLLRIWRRNTAKMEQRWMDEHIVLKEGKSLEFDNDIVDRNLNNLTWWIEKHNNYATREAVDVLNRKYDLLRRGTQLDEKVTANQNQQKRWFKNKIYLRMPLFVRPFIYFLYRYILLLGFLDGKRGLIWHFLQGFWYRFLVDTKVFHIEYMSVKSSKSVYEILTDVYDMKIDRT